MSLAPTTLQQICCAATAGWITEWSGLVGQVSARATAMQHENGCSHYSTNFAQEPQTTVDYNTESVALCLPQFNRLISAQQATSTVPRDNKNYDTVNKKRGRSCKCKKRYGKMDRLITVQYDDEVTRSCNSVDETCRNTDSSQCHRYGKNLNIYALENRRMDSFNREIISTNNKMCSAFLTHYLPPVLIDQIVSLSWKQLTRLVAHRSHNVCSAEYQVADWIRRAAVFLILASKVTERKFPLDISGIPENLIERVLNTIYNYFPLKALSSLVLPKEDFKKSPVEIGSPCRENCRKILMGTYLTSVILNSRICDDSILSNLSQLPLKELSISSNLITEKGVVNGLCALELQTLNEVVDVIQTGNLKLYPESPLRKSLQKLDIMSQNLSKLVYYVIPIIFSELQHYSPHRNLLQCMQNCERLARVSNGGSQQHVSENTFNLLRMNVGCPSREQLIEATRICPQLQEVSVIVDLNAEQILPALEFHVHLTSLELTYYPSFSSSPPKLDAGVLLDVLGSLKGQLKSLSLTGFSIMGGVMHEMSQLPELQQLNFTDCWLSNPRLKPDKPFPSLEKLSLNFLPANSTMQLLTMGENVQSLNLDLKESEWEGNALTDDYIKYLVSSGIVTSVQTFTASSSYLTITSLKTLSSLPSLKVVGYLASWGLTEEELRCIDHSGPQHILYNL